MGRGREQEEDNEDDEYYDDDVSRDLALPHPYRYVL
jgi:hypothetical protein